MKSFIATILSIWKKEKGRAWYHGRRRCLRGKKASIQTNTHTKAVVYIYGQMTRKLN